MSGPKVVRVVTREERVRQCLVVLARLDQAIDFWQDGCQRMGHLSRADQDKVIARRNELEVLFRKDQFDAFTRAANAEVAYLESDLLRRQTSFVEEKAREVSRRESALQIARALLSELKAKTAPIDERLLEALELAVSAGDRKTVDKVLAQYFKSLSSVQEKLMTPEQRELASRLASGMDDASLEHWRAPSVKADPRSETVARGLAELALHAPQQLVADYEKRLDAVRVIADDSLRNLKLDSLVIEINEARLRETRFNALCSSLKLLGTELKAYGEGTESLNAELHTALDSKQAERMEKALQFVRTGLVTLQKQKAAAERRRAVLGGLAKLGYVVNEGMSTALAERGRVVVQKPDFPDYGIELFGGAESARLQVRTVAFASTRDTSRDSDAERRWCSDFTNLRKDLEVLGTQTVIEQAKAIGEIPLKVVELDTGEKAVSSRKQLAFRSRVT